MAGFAMVLYDPPGESRHAMLDQCLESYFDTVDRAKHGLLFWDNGTTKHTKEVVLKRSGVVMPDIQRENLGTAKGINRLWVEIRKSLPTTNLGKIDPDVVFHEFGWACKLEECIARDPKIGQIGLKRPDLLESPNNAPGQWSHSTLHMLPHTPGERWLVVEKVHHVMGTCVLHSAALIDKVGYLWQPGLYGFDDGDMSCRCQCAGFYSCFYPHYHIDHIDPGNTAFQPWKEAHSGQLMGQFLSTRKKYESGELSLYRGPE